MPIGNEKDPFMIRHLLSAAALGALTLSTACSQPSSTTELQKEVIEQIIRAYLLENPEVMEEAIIELKETKFKELFKEDLEENLLSNLIFIPSAVIYG